MIRYTFITNSFSMGDNRMSHQSACFINPTQTLKLSETCLYIVAPVAVNLLHKVVCGGKQSKTSPPPPYGTVISTEPDFCFQLWRDRLSPVAREPSEETEHQVQSVFQPVLLWYVQAFLEDLSQNATSEH